VTLPRPRPTPQSGKSVNQPAARRLTACLVACLSVAGCGGGARTSAVSGTSAAARTSTSSIPSADGSPTVGTPRQLAAWALVSASPESRIITIRYATREACAVVPHVETHEDSRNVSVLLPERPPPTGTICAGVLPVRIVKVVLMSRLDRRRIRGACSQDPVCEQLYPGPNR